MGSLPRELLAAWPVLAPTADDVLQAIAGRPELSGLPELHRGRHGRPFWRYCDFVRRCGAAHDRVRGRSGKLSVFEARTLLGIQSRYEMAGILKAHGVFLDQTADDVAKDAVEALASSR